LHGENLSNSTKHRTNTNRYFHERGKSGEHETLNDVAQQICESQKEDVRGLLSDIYYGQGADASEMNQPELCLKHYTALLNLRKEISKTSKEGKQDIYLAIAYNEMGIGYMMNNMYAKGTECFHMSISIYESLHDYSKVMATLSFVNLGLSYWLQNECTRASEILLDILRERERVFGINDDESFK
jgi:hypothetical protein